MTRDRGRSGGWVDPYAGLHGRRVFIAVPLPPSTAAEVAGIVEAVREQALPSDGRDVRWVRLDGLHLTLRFLGPTPEDGIERLAGVVDDVAAAAAPIDAIFAGAGSFPRSGRIRTLWVGLGEGIPELTRLERDLDARLAASGWAPEMRPFSPHLTLARSDGIAAAPLVADRLAAVIGDRRIASRFDRLGLYESVTGGGPARYVPVHEAPMAAER